MCRSRFAFLASSVTIVARRIGVRDRQQGGGARLPPRLHRRCGGRARCARARGRGGHREVDALARGRRACARAGIARPLVATGRGRARASPTWAWAICSRTSSTRSCLRCRRRGGARSRSRSSCEEASGDPVDPRALGDRDAQRAAAARRTTSRFSSRSTTSSGSTPRRRARSRSRCEGSTRTDVLLLLARRLVDGAQPSGLEQALGAERVQRLPVGPLSVGALHRLLRDRLGRPFARQTLLRIHERSGGNPFFALELARVLDADVDPLQPLPVPETLEELVRARISGLPASTREALALASALGTPSESLLERAGVAADALDAGGRRARDRARERDDSLHPPAALVGPLPGPRRGAAERSRDASRRSSTTRSSAPVTSRCRGTRRTPTSPACSTTPRDWRPIAARRPSRPSSPSRRSG